MNDAMIDTPPKRKRRRKTAARKRTGKKKTPRKYGRFFLILPLCTLLTAIGVFFFVPQVWQELGGLLPVAERQKPANQLHEIREPDTAEQLARILFIRRAVEARLDRSNYVPIEHISPELKKAIVAIEDRRFYEHTGFDLTGMARATLVNIQYGRIEEGASTITQQLVKNLFLANEQTFTRKAQELLLALDIELTYSKDEILEMYLNVVYYGSGFFGVNAASEGYYGKSPAALNLPESSMLAGVPNAPSELSPFTHFIAAKKRQAVVLDTMEAQGLIDARTAEDAKMQPLIFRPEESEKNKT
ncbi:glycosyl transferase family 51 [Selenomonas sp. oral taxon 920]|uniref:transglycosylase domain-containing protein n=1 Tax=Selenomonas sp. oral taxon 920 TaxID=1884263 RepID=UPI000840F377|nr:transglycosylase domain-containing protein [Selenomonas sp. oral taxon 920]AOH48229.1 glycosyl transferase family 51 [Selenomonas sp. oral taxon 920]